MIILSSLLDLKGSSPSFKKFLNAFHIPYTVLHEMDGRSEKDDENYQIIENMAGNRRVVIPKKLETIVGKGVHFKDNYQAFQHFSNPVNFTADFLKVVAELFQD